MQKTKKALPLIVFCVLLAAAVPVGVCQDWNFSPDWLLSIEGNLAVLLDTPVNNSVTTELNCTFTYAPVSINDTIYSAALYIDGSPVAFNASAVVNATANSLNYTFPANGVYVWNVQVWNSTAGVFADSNYTLIVNAPVPTVAPTPTPTVTPATANSDFNLIAIFTTIVSFAFFVLGLYEGVGRVGDIDFARAMIFYFVSLLASALCVGLYLSMSTPFAVAYWGLPVFIIIMDLTLIVFTSWKAYLHKMAETPSRNRRYNPNES